MSHNVIKIVSIVLFLSAFLGCGKDQTPERAESSEENGMPAEVKDVDDPNYWDNAELVWSDEFDGDSVSTENWVYETGADGWGNNELQNYTSSGNAEVGNGILNIIAKKEKSGTANYSSARLNSKKSFTYGRFEFRAKMPDLKGKGIWPALWMLGANITSVGWPACGEIDIMEYVSYIPNTTHFSIHSTANNHVNGTQVTSGPLPLATIEEEFHTYGFLWTSTYLKFYLDDVDNIKLAFVRPPNSSSDNWPFSQPFYFLMNIAVGGNWGGAEGVDDTIFPAVMEVDYVRVYQVK